MKTVQEKIKLAHSLLEDQKIDLWLIYVRETAIMADPCLSLLIGHGVTWDSFFMFTRKGDAIVIVGQGDQENFVRSDCFTEVHTHTENPADLFRETIERLDPLKIALNYSSADPSADGLTHGMYLNLCEFLKGTPYVERFMSAESLAQKLRAQKSKSEIEYLTRALNRTTDVWEAVQFSLSPGLSEIEIANLIDSEIRKTGGEPSFETIVNAGSKTKPGHSQPTEAIVEKGELLHVDFGIMLDNYCSDIQRLVYFKKDNEKMPPGELVKAFTTVRDIITLTGKKAKPGVCGFEIDALARQLLKDKGYPDYPHALGHQLGRAVHDGGAIIGPKWPRYGNTTSTPIEENNVFTLELEIILDGIGCVGLEEDVIITTNGARFLGVRQEELIVI